MSRKSEREAREKLAKIHQRADDQNYGEMQGKMPHDGATTGYAATYREGPIKSIAGTIRALRGK